MGIDHRAIVHFLGNTPPFNRLDPETIENTARKVSIEFYPKGLMILRQNGPPCENLQLIKSGEVKIYVDRGEDAEDIPLGVRGEGQVFGFVSLLSGDKSRANALATQDTVCYVLPKSDLIDLINRKPHLRDYFIRSFFWNFIDRSRTDSAAHGFDLGEGDKLLFTTPVRELIRGDAVTVDDSVSIQEAAARMSDMNASSLVVVDEEGVPVGIVTDRDLREKVVARSVDFQTEISAVMSPPFIRVDGGEPSFEALLRMIRYNVDHLLVVESGRLSGVVTNHDFLVLQGASPLSIARSIAAQSSVEGLKALGPQIHQIAAMLLRDGVKARQVCRLLSELREQFLRRLMDILITDLGPSPIPVALALIGSEGRREQTFAGPLDCILVVGEDVPPSGGSASRHYLERLMAHLRQELAACSLPAMTQAQFDSGPSFDSPTGWRNRFLNALAGTRGLRATRLLDLRHVWGEEELTHELWTGLYQGIGATLRHFPGLADSIVQPSRGFFRGVLAGWTGNREPIDIKAHALRPIVEGVRLLAAEQGIRSTSTLDRIRQMSLPKGSWGRHLENLPAVFEFLTQMRLEDQIQKMDRKVEPDSLFQPGELTALTRKTLKDALRMVARFHVDLKKHFQHDTMSA